MTPSSTGSLSYRLLVCSVLRHRPAGLMLTAAAVVLAAAAAGCSAAGGASPPDGATSGTGGQGPLNTGGAFAGNTGGGGNPTTPGSGGAGPTGTGGRGPVGSGGQRVTGTGGTLGFAGASGNNGSGGGGPINCPAPPPQEQVVGWASMGPGTTGGGAVAPLMVTTLAGLNSAAAGGSPAVIWVQGSLSGSIRIGSNKTVVGLCGAELHGHVDMSGSTNVVFRNLKVVGYGVSNCALDPSYDPAVGCSSGQDAISVQNRANHIWIDHCDISDGTDGNLDITGAADFVTISWTKFHYSPRTDPVGNDSTGASGHRFSNLVGGTDTPAPGYDDAHALNVTWHHNWWADNVVERQPRVRFGKNHLFNNVWSSKTSKYCVRAGIDAQILIENSVFTSVANPQQFNTAADQATAFITATNDLYPGTTGVKAVGGGGTAFTTPPYVYAPDAVDSVMAAVQAGAGPQ